MVTALDVIQVAALTLGVGAAAAALFGRYRTLPRFLTGPAICRLEHGGCQVLFRTRTASLLGVPNAALGLALYAALIAGLAARWPTAWLLGGASVALAMSVYLARYLMINRLECRVCWAGHIANALLWICLALRLASN
jgi:uncharacterized membrane protein